MEGSGRNLLEADPPTRLRGQALHIDACDEFMRERPNLDTRLRGHVTGQAWDEVPWVAWAGTVYHCARDMKNKAMSRYRQDGT